MLRRRGYETDAGEVEFVAHRGEERMLVRYSARGGVEEARAFLADVEQRGLLLTFEPWSAAAAALAGGRVENWAVRYTQLDIFDYVPLHEFADHRRKDKLPRIYVDDPVARYYGARVGDVFRITRPSPTAGVTYYYRVVIPSAGVFHNIR